MNGHAWFHLQGLRRLVRKGNKRKFKMKIYVSAWYRTSYPWLSGRTPCPFCYWESRLPVFSNLAVQWSYSNILTITKIKSRSPTLLLRLKNNVWWNKSKLWKYLIYTKCYVGNFSETHLDIDWIFWRKTNVFGTEKTNFFTRAVFFVLLLGSVCSMESSINLHCLLTQRSINLSIFLSF